MTKQLFGSIEAGGTKFVVAVGDSELNIIEKAQFPTTAPAETLAKCVDFFTAHPVSALGIGSFGPIDIDKKSATYGQVLATPKPGWAGADVVGTLKAALNVPIAFTTDVNASAYGEYIGGSGKDVDSLVYFTIGTGIGGGAIQDGKFIGGTGHAEMGHALCVPRPDDDYQALVLSMVAIVLKAWQQGLRLKAAPAFLDKICRGITRRLNSSATTLRKCCSIHTSTCAQLKLF